MRTLTLIRHAKSSWADGMLNDYDRPLNKRGQENAPLMGRVLRDLGVSFELIVSSPALRAITTARFIALQLGYPENALVENPDLYAATTAGLLNIENLPTCAVVSIAFDADTWQAVYRNTGRLIRYEYPRKYIDPA